MKSMSIRYEYDPNEPGSVTSSGLLAWGRILCAFLSVFSIGYYSYSLFQLITGKYSIDIFYAAGSILIFSVIDFLLISVELDRTSKKEFAKYYFLFALGGLVEHTGIIGIFASIFLLINKGVGVNTLIIFIVSEIVFLIIIVLIFRSFKEIKEQKIRLFMKKEEYIETRTEDDKCNNRNEENGLKKEKFIYCHKCGKKMLSDSSFCSSCGNNLIE